MDNNENEQEIVNEEANTNAQENVATEEKSLEEKAKEVLNDVEDSTSNFGKEDIENNKAMALLCYLSILVLIPFFFENKSEWVKFHAKQGMNLFIFEVIAGIIAGVIPWIGGFIGGILEALWIVLSLIGIINVLNGKAKELPIINKCKIVK